MYAIKVSRIPESGFANEEEHQVLLKELDLADPFVGENARLTWRFQRAFEKFFGQVTAAADLGLVCSRCLANVTYSVRTDFGVQFQPVSKVGLSSGRGRKSDSEAEEEYEAQDALQITEFSGDFLPLGEEVRQELLLKVPLRPLCKADCAGLCEKCGDDLNQGACGCSK